MTSRLAFQPQPQPRDRQIQEMLRQIHGLQKRGKFRESRPLCEKLASMGVHTADSLHFHGLALRAGGDLMGALVRINAAVEMRPKDARLLNSLGVILLELKEHEAAIAIFKRATEADGKLYDAWGNLGVALKRVERYEAAELALRCAFEIDRTRVEPLIEMVGLMMDQRLYEKAAEALDYIMAECGDRFPNLRLKRLQIAVWLEDFDYIGTHYESIDRSGLSVDDQAHFANIWAKYLEIEGRDEEGIALLEKWARVKSKHQSQIQSYLGVRYAETGRLDEGIAWHKRALKRDPEHVAARYNLAFLQFQKGADLPAAFANYEWRWQSRSFPSQRRVFDAPRWRGEPLEGKKLLVWREQGIGDEVRFASLLPELENAGAEVTFEAAPKLRPLWERSFPWATIRNEGPADCRGEAAYGDYDYQIPVGSLGAILRPSVDAFEARQAPWIRRDFTAEQAVRDNLGLKKSDILIGLCWRSSNQATSRNRYFLRIEDLVPLKALDGCTFLNVQYDSAPEELTAIRGLGLPLHHCANLDQKNDLIGASALIGACDLVISVGVAVADLAAGLGRPLIQIAKETSEIYLGTDHVPWFPTCMSVRMPPDSGAGAIADIIARWPSIREWMASIPTGDRESAVAAGDDAASTPAPETSLDHDYGALGAWSRPDVRKEAAA
ncbi:tetratricopeptide repeat protein [Jiella sp. M17.18]|uniref:tetratricopeptide repeat protein n=1 Tax=Jiella sp. M17.18 TaxID=3234247 RepID=UPI0034DEA1B6